MKKKLLHAIEKHDLRKLIPALLGENSVGELRCRNCERLLTVDEVGVVVYENGMFHFLCADLGCLPRDVVERE